MVDVTLYHGDCLVEMGKIADGSVDTIICDLPYASTACKWDRMIPLEPLWEHYKRVIKSKGTIVLFSSQPFTSRLVMSNLEWFKYEWIWDKALASGHLNAKKMPLRRHDNILVFSSQTMGNHTYNPQMVTRGKPRWKGTVGGGSNAGAKPYGKYNACPAFNNKYYPTTIIFESNANRKEKQHPTQKPVALLEYLIKTYTNEGETVLDNCFGSGTTGVACINTRRSFVGIEIDGDYFNLAQRRIADARRRLALPRQLKLEAT